MATFTFFGKTLDLPAVRMPTNTATCDPTAWQSGHFVTVRLTNAIPALKVDPNSRHLPGPYAPPERGAWVLIGGAIHASAPLVDHRFSLPVVNPRSMLALTHTSAAHVAADTVLNVGLASARFGDSGGEFQAEYVSGPPVEFTLLPDKSWRASGVQA